MKLEKQVCTLEQAKRLKELGVEQKGLYSWAYSGLNDKWDISSLCVEALDIIQATNFPTLHPTKRPQFYSAFTAANSYSYLLIYLLENGIITPEEVNARLKD